tara:strand:- start:26 stop:475 length:450 start_codon:yes stop_codon:yes gene_type:complete
MNTLKSLSYLFNRDLERLITELKAYQNEEDLWRLKGEILNTPGNLALHLVGNLNHFVGHVIGETDYQRKRDLEFSSKPIPLTEILNQIEETQKVVNHSLENMSAELLEKEYPIQVFGVPYTYVTMLIHLSGHLNYHLGQINYHRRLVNS